MQGEAWCCHSLRQECIKGTDEDLSMNVLLTMWDFKVDMSSSQWKSRSVAQERDWTEEKS